MVAVPHMTPVSVAEARPSIVVLVMVLLAKEPTGLVVKVITVPSATQFSCWSTARPLMITVVPAGALGALAWAVNELYINIYARSSTPIHQLARPRDSELEAETREEVCDCDLLSRAIPAMRSPA